MVSHNLLAGNMIFDSHGRTDQIVAWILFREPTPIRTRRADIPEDLAAIIHQALAKAPGDRFADASAMRDALLPFARALPA